MYDINTKSKAVIYPARTVSGYGHIYSLGIAGIPVVALAHVDCANFKSRYVREKYIVPDPHDDQERFLSWLIDYGKKQSIKPALFMVEDAYAYLASLYQKELCPYFLFPFIPIDIIDVFFHKGAMYRKAAEVGIKVPESIYSPLDKETIDTWYSYPAVIKPVISRFKVKGKKIVCIRTFPEIFGGKAVFAFDASGLFELTQRIKCAELDYCVQEYIPGANSNLYTIYFLATEDGHIPSFSTHYKCRQFPADFGTTSVSQSKSVPQLRGLAERFCKATGYMGPATMEFKLHEEDNDWVLMEINARFGFSIRRSTVKGVNMPVQQYLFSTGQQLMNSMQHDDGKFWIDIPGDVKGLLWRQNKKQWRLPIRQIIKPYLYFREAVLNARDPLPGLSRLGSSANRGLWRLIKMMKYLMLRSIPALHKNEDPAMTADVVNQKRRI
jgi:D-aspartate ligase